METIHITVHGRVQGVGFRWYTVQTANRLGVTGWVRNKPDGTVEVEATASKPTLDTFTHALRDGPTMSRVTQVQVAKAAYQAHAGFEVKY